MNEEHCKTRNRFRYALIQSSGALSLFFALILVLISAPKYDEILRSCIVFALYAGGCFLLCARKVRQPWKSIFYSGLAIAVIILLEAFLRLFFSLRISDFFLMTN